MYSVEYNQNCILYVLVYRVSQKCCGSLKGVIRGMIANNFFLCENTFRGFVNEIIAKSTDQSEREPSAGAPALAWPRAEPRCDYEQARRHAPKEIA